MLLNKKFHEQNTQVCFVFSHNIQIFIWSFFFLFLSSYLSLFLLQQHQWLMKFNMAIRRKRQNTSNDPVKNGCQLFIEYFIFSWMLISLFIYGNGDGTVFDRNFIFGTNSNFLFQKWRFNSIFIPILRHKFGFIFATQQKVYINCLNKKRRWTHKRFKFACHGRIWYCDYAYKSAYRVYYLFKSMILVWNLF